MFQKFIKKITSKIIFLIYLDLADPDRHYDYKVLILLLNVDEVIVLYIPETSASHSDTKVTLFKESCVDYELVFLLKSLDVLAYHMGKGVSEVCALFIGELLELLDFLSALASDVILKFLLYLNCDHYIIKLRVIIFLVFGQILFGRHLKNRA
jgi:hypothetical protein